MKGQRGVRLEIRNSVILYAANLIRVKAVYTRGHTIGPMFANSLRIFPKTYFDLKVGTESLQELTKSLRIWCYFHCFGLRFEFQEISVYAYNF